MRGENKSCSGIALMKAREGLKLGGCPICRLLRRTEEGILEGIAYEGVNDPGVREELRRSLGLCPYHAWMFVRVVSRPGVLDGLGGTIIYEDMLTEYLEKLRTESSTPRGSCLLCRLAEEFEDIFASNYAACFDEGALLQEYASSDTILCDRHFKLVLSKMRITGARNKLRSIQVEKIEDLLNKMRGFVRKNDYRAKENISAGEAMAWIKAVEVLKGYETSMTMLQAGRKASARRNTGVLKLLRKLGLNEA